MHEYATNLSQFQLKIPRSARQCGNSGKEPLIGRRKKYRENWA